MISNVDDVYAYIYIFGYVYTGAQSEILQGRGGLVGLGHLYKHFVKNTKRKAPTVKDMGFFPPRSIKITFWIENLT